MLIAICLVIACGISTFVGSLSTLDTLRGSMQRYYERYRFADVFVSLTRAPELLRDRLAAIEGVAAVETRVVAGVTLDVEGVVEAVTGRIVSLPDVGEPRLNSVYLRKGRLPERWRESEVLVSEGFAQAHGLLPGDEVAAILNGRRKRLRIVGIALSPEYIYLIRPGGAFPDDRLFGVLWMRREAIARAFDMDGAFNDAALDLTRTARQDHVIATVDRLLEQYGGRGAFGREIQVSHWYLNSEFDQLAVTGFFVPLIFLGVAAFLLNVVMSRMISQQREQIALLKSFGYSNLQVGLHYLAMVIAVVVVAGMLGVLGGAWMGQGLIGMYGQFYRFPSLDYALGPQHFGRALIVGFVAAMLGTLQAIWRAVRLPPAEAMRPEAPPSYRPTLLERIGLQRLLTPTMRMVLRDLERRPVKSALSIVGIAFGVSILVVGSYFEDALDFLMDTQFGYAQREDVTLTLTEPRSTRALHEIRRMPGVARVEGFRALAVRLRCGQRSRLTTVTGMPRGTTLQRLIDRDLKVVSLPPRGLVLTDKLARILDVTPGDTLQFEVLEGRRPTLRVELVRIVESYIGNGAYMDLGALNRLMGEGRTVSGAHLMLDDRQFAGFQTRVKNTPQIAGVAMLSRARQSFEETAAGSMRIMTFFFVVFASVIACGVVYNNARILVAEHAREFASLRVLGFRRREVSGILLLELWLLTALAIPVGLLLGYGFALLLTPALDTELYKIPLVIEPATYGFAGTTVAVASIVAGLIVRRRIDRLDLVEVLKTRE